MSRLRFIGMMVLALALGNPIAALAEQSPVKNALYTPMLSEPMLVIPRPKKITVPSGIAPFVINAKTCIVVPKNARPEELRGATILRREIESRFGLRLPQITATTAAPRANAILVGGPTANPMIPSLQRNGNVPKAPANPEGYAVGVTKNAVAIVGTDAQGSLWGAQTVVQLLARDAQNKPVIRPARIEDYPTLRMRAVHLFYGQDALPFQKKLIDRIFSRYKMNGLFIQAERVHWDHDPAVAPAWGGSKADLQQEIAYAKERGITAYPLIQSYGHMEWLLEKSHPDYAEDPEKPYALNYTNPEAVAYQEGFNREADDLFAAPAFHVGLDEVTMRGRMPYRSAPKTYTELFLGAANHWHDFLAKRHKQMWMWADQALFPADVKPSFGTASSAKIAAQIRAGLPKDIVMVDWQYSARPSYPSLTRLQEAGFQNVVGATWYYPDGIQNFSRAAAQAKALGMIQTTWCGYESTEKVLATEERRQFTAMILAADYFWNGGEGPTPDKLPYDPIKIFTQQWDD